MFLKSGEKFKITNWHWSHEPLEQKQQQPKEIYLGFNAQET